MFTKLIPHDNIVCKTVKSDWTRDILKRFFTVHDKVFNKEMNSSEKIPKCVMESDDEYVYVPLTMVDAVTDYLTENGEFVDTSDIKKVRKPTFVVKDEWYEKFKAREGQKEVFDSMISSNRGILQLPTGFGKSLIIVALADSFKEDGNILIVTPFNSIKEELIYRFKKIGIEMEFEFNVNQRINIINAAGYCASHFFDDEECRKWMANVKMIEIDECENIVESMKSVFKQLTGCDYVYGFSASADKIYGKKLELKKGLFNFTESSYSVLKYVGESIAYQKPKKHLDVHVIKSSFGNKRNPRSEFIDYNLSISSVVYHANFSVCLKKTLEMKRDILFVPCNSKKMSKHVYDCVKNLGYSPARWDSSEMVSECGVDNYDDLKKYCDEGGKLDVLIGTKVAFFGIDINRLSDCLIFQGTQFNTVVQTLGRCFRNDHPSLWLYEETDPTKNPIYRSCHFKRMNIVKTNYGDNYQIYNHII